MSGGTSYNGWPASDSASAIAVDTAFEVNGVTFPGGAKSGDVETVFTYLVQQLDLIEPLVPGWCWGWEYRANVNNPNTLSCHASATALDYNAPNHPNGGSAYGGWTDTQVDQVYSLLDYLEVVDWGADFSGTKDPMHFEISGDASAVAAIAQKIRNNQEDDEMTNDDWDRMSDLIDARLAVALTQTESVSTDDEAADGNPNRYTIAAGVGRAIRLSSFTATGQVIPPHK